MTPMNPAIDAFPDLFHRARVLLRPFFGEQADHIELGRAGGLLMWMARHKIGFDDVEIVCRTNRKWNLVSKSTHDHPNRLDAHLLGLVSYYCFAVRRSP